MTITAENVVVPSAVPDKRRALGRGLESLLPGGARVASSAAMAPMSTVAPDGARPAVLPDVQAAAAASGSRVMQVPLDKIDESRSIRSTKTLIRRGSTSTIRRCRSWRSRSARTESCSRSWSGQRQPDVLSSFSGSGAAGHRSWRESRRSPRSCAASLISRRPK